MITGDLRTALANLEAARRQLTTLRGDLVALAVDARTAEAERTWIATAIGADAGGDLVRAVRDLVLSERDAAAELVRHRAALRAAWDVLGFDATAGWARMGPEWTAAAEQWRDEHYLPLEPKYFSGVLLGL